MNLDSIPAAGQVAAFLAGRKLQGYVNHILDSSLVNTDDVDVTDLAAFKSRARAINMYKRVLKQFGTPKNVKRVGREDRARYAFLTENGKRAVTIKAFDLMANALRAEDPDKFLDLPTPGDYVVNIKREQDNKRRFRITKVLSNAFDPDPKRDLPEEGQEEGVLVGNIFENVIFTSTEGGTRAELRVYDGFKKLTGAGVWNVLGKLVPGIPLEVSVWIMTPTIPFQRVPDHGGEPAVEVVDVSKIKLSRHQRVFLDYMVEGFIDKANKSIKKLHEAEQTGNKAKIAKWSDKVTRFLNLKEGQGTKSVGKITGLGENRSILSALEKRGLINYVELSAWDFNKFEVHLLPTAFALTGKELPEIPDVSSEEL